MNLNTTRLGQGGIVLAIIGMIVMFIPNQGTFDSQTTGLVLLTLGFLILMLSYIIERLQRLGAEYWALGSIIVYLGVVIFSIPLLLLVAQVNINISLQWTMAIGGILLVVLGFVTTIYELNTYIISAINKFRIAFTVGIERLWLRIRHSPVVVLIFIDIIIILFFLFTDLDQSLSSAITGIGFPVNAFQVMTVFIAIGIAMTLFEIRELLFAGAFFFWSWIVIISKTIVEWITHLPQYLARFWNFTVGIAHLLGRQIAVLSAYLRENALQIAQNIPMIGYLFAGISIIGYWRNNDPVLLQISTILLIIPTTIIFIANPEWIKKRIQATQRFAYNVSQGTRRAYRRFRSDYCPHCQTPLPSKSYGMDTCPNCLKPIEYCSICRGIISPEKEDFERCRSCHHPIHSSHMENWFSISNNCPWCKEKFF